MNRASAIEKAVNQVNDVVEEITLKAADAAIEPDPQHVAGAANEQVYLPEATATVASHSGRITPSALRGLLTHGLYSEFAGMINGRSVASGWGDGKEGRHVITKTPTIATATTTSTVASGHPGD